MGFRDRGHRRHGGAPPRPALLGAQAGPSADRPGHIDAFEPGLLSPGRDDHLQLPGPRHDASRQARLVRRRPDAGAAERARQRVDDGRRGRRMPVRREPGTPHVRHLRGKPPPPPRLADAGVQEAGQDHPALPRHNSFPKNLTSTKLTFPSRIFRIKRRIQ